MPAKVAVESLGGKWLDVPMSEEESEKSKATGGYAWTPSEQYIKDQAAVVDKALSNADIVITTAQIPGRQAPRLVHQATLDKMKAGSVLIDMAAGTGGNVEGSVPNQLRPQTMAFVSLVQPIYLPCLPRSLRIYMPII